MNDKWPKKHFSGTFFIRGVPGRVFGAPGPEKSDFFINIFLESQEQQKRKKGKKKKKIRTELDIWTGPENNCLPSLPSMDRPTGVFMNQLICRKTTPTCEMELPFYKKPP